MWAIICLPIALPIPAWGQGFHAPGPAMLSPIELPQPASTLPSLYPTDITPVPIGRERDLLKPGMTYYLFQRLPNNLWFNLTTETSQRYEANVFQSRTRYRSDYVYRILPNVSLGYQVYKKVSIYCNYFAIKDVFVGHNQLTFPTTQSVSLGFRRDFTIGRTSNLQLDFQSRELWQSSHVHQADLLPSFTFTRFVGSKTVLFFNSVLQMRGQYYSVAPTREIDPFYTMGALYSKGSWMFSSTGTLVTNFRHPPFNDAIPNQSNNSIIADFEVSHPVPKLPYLVTFVRAEPIWNWNGHGLQGLSGFDFRLFAGLRLNISKPAYQSSADTLKQRLKQYNMSPGGHNSTSTSSPATPTAPSTPANQTAVPAPPANSSAPDVLPTPVEQIANPADKQDQDNGNEQLIDSAKNSPDTTPNNIQAHPNQ